MFSDYTIREQKLSFSNWFVTSTDGWLEDKMLNDVLPTAATVFHGYIPGNHETAFYF